MSEQTNQTDADCGILTDDEIEAVNRRWNCGGTCRLDWAREIEDVVRRRAATDVGQMRQDAARYNWLIGKVFTRGETCLALYEEFGGSPLPGETIRQFMSRYIDSAMVPDQRHGIRRN